jgi:SAM-dependent methyltransferase
MKANDQSATILHGVLDRYSPEWQANMRPDVARQSFHLDVVADHTAAGDVVVDIGGGLSSFCPGVAAMGRRAVLVDDFVDTWYSEADASISELHERGGVTIVSRDVIADGLGLDAGSAAMVASFDTMEHLHASPKALFAEVMAALRPGGWFFLGVPNCVNLRKRITVPLGRGKWSQMGDWYENPVFRGHVREPDVDDLLYIARDMGLVEVQTFGRNWQGYQHPRPSVRRVIPYVDRIMQRRPTLCSDIYLLGRKPARGPDTTAHG